MAVVDKPAGWTSHDVVAKARGLLGTRRVGHSGTLDPDAARADDLLPAVARRVPAADASLRAAEGRRSSFLGLELAGTTVGGVGPGRTRRLVAQRLAAFGTGLIAYDPYVSPAMAAQLGIELVDLDELVARADVISIHLPKTPQTRGLIGAARLAKAKPGLLIVNAARGGLVDENALAAAIRDGVVAGAGIDVFDIEIDEHDPDKLVDIIASLEPTFGGINLEDIKAPECFRIERELRARMAIPVFHDDQHGTAIIVGAAVRNALKLQDKSIEDIKIVTSGAGAAALSCVNSLVALGARPENILLTDIEGVVYRDRPGLDPTLDHVARDTTFRTLDEALEGAIRQRGSLQ